MGAEGWGRRVGGEAVKAERGSLWHCRDSTQVSRMLIVPGTGAGGLGATYGDSGNTGVTMMRAWDPREQVLSSEAWPPHALGMFSPGSGVR